MARVPTVRPDHAADPGEVFGAGSERAVRPGPLRLAVQSHEAVTVGVHFAGAVVGAVVVAEAARSPPASVVGHHFTPGLCFESRSTGRRSIRLVGRFSGWLGAGLRNW